MYAWIYHPCSPDVANTRIKCGDCWIPFLSVWTLDSESQVFEWSIDVKQGRGWQYCFHVHRENNDADMDRKEERDHGAPSVTELNFVSWLLLPYKISPKLALKTIISLCSWALQIRNWERVQGDGLYLLHNLRTYPRWKSVWLETGVPWRVIHSLACLTWTGKPWSRTDSQNSSPWALHVA